MYLGEEHTFSHYSGTLPPLPGLFNKTLQIKDLLNQGRQTNSTIQKILFSGQQLQ
jgi:hypothetical protein